MYHRPPFGHRNNNSYLIDSLAGTIIPVKMLGEILMSFSTRLKELRAQKKTTQSTVAHIAGLTDRTMRKYEAGEIEPTLSVLIALADYFDVSLDYLVGRSDNPEVR
jgi:DNA-binding XRE family transcriptional regulator